MTPIDAKLHERRWQQIERLLAAQNRGDLEAALACFAHARYELIGNNRVYDGADEVRHYYEMTRHYFPDLRFDAIDVHHGDDAVVLETWMTGTHLGSGPDFEATGRCFRCRTAVIFGFEGERLVGARVYYDTGTIARQLA
ncbi:MAG TPA: ester cyclase [Acidimicrobiales bacterium]|nr:ester cyclase [Acidimicrobiales bacterium]